MDFYGDYHTHTKASDGKGEIEDSIKIAQEKSLKELVISEHGFSAPNLYSITKAKYIKQQQEIALLKEKYPKINLMHSVEGNIINDDGDIDIEESVINQLDILIAGFHVTAMPKLSDWAKFIVRGWKSSYFTPSNAVIKQNTQAFIKMIKKYKLDILAHPNNRMLIDVEEVAKACADYNTLYEINVKHFELFKQDFDKILSTDVTLIVNSDAHRPERVGEFSQVKNFLENQNIDVKRIANWGKKPQFRSSK